MQKNVYGEGSEGIVIPTQAISGTTPIVSTVTWINMLDNVGYQLVTTGTVAGAWKVEVSNNYAVTWYNNQAAGAGDWFDYTSRMTTIAAVLSGGSNQIAEHIGCTCRAMRLTFTPTSGAGNVSAYFYGKGL